MSEGDEQKRPDSRAQYEFLKKLRRVAEALGSSGTRAFSWVRRRKISRVQFLGAAYLAMIPFFAIFYGLYSDQFSYSTLEASGEVKRAEDKLDDDAMSLTSALGDGLRDVGIEPPDEGPALGLVSSPYKGAKKQSYVWAARGIHVEIALDFEHDKRKLSCVITAQIDNHAVRKIDTSGLQQLPPRVGDAEYKAALAFLAAAMKRKGNPGKPFFQGDKLAICGTFCGTFCGSMVSCTIGTKRDKGRGLGVLLSDGSAKNAARFFSVLVGRLPPGEGDIVTSLYLSVVTITTLGFGDIVPVTPLARALVAAQSIIGLVLIGLFVSALADRASGRDRPPESEP